MGEIRSSFLLCTINMLCIFCERLALIACPGKSVLTLSRFQSCILSFLYVFVLFKNIFVT